MLDLNKSAIKLLRSCSIIQNVHYDVFCSTYYTSEALLSYGGEKIPPARVRDYSSFQHLAKKCEVRHCALLRELIRTDNWTSVPCILTGEDDRHATP